VGSDEDGKDGGVVHFAIKELTDVKGKVKYNLTLEITW
jgi:hypothetical protein